MQQWALDNLAFFHEQVDFSEKIKEETQNLGQFSGQLLEIDNPLESHSVSSNEEENSSSVLNTDPQIRPVVTVTPPETVCQVHGIKDPIKKGKRKSNTALSGLLAT